MTNSEFASEFALETTDENIGFDTLDSITQGAWEIGSSYHDSLVVSELLGTYAHIECETGDEYEPMTAASYDSLMSEVTDLGIDPNKFDWIA